MAKSSALWTDQLASLIGLDNETIATQIIPFLDSFNDERQLVSHLEELVGTGSSTANSFIRDFARSRFPKTQMPSDTAASTSTSTSSRFESGTKRKGKQSLAERASIGQPLPPRKVDEAYHLDQLTAEFSGMGKIHRKDFDEQDALFAGFAKLKKGKDVGHHTESATQSAGQSSAPVRVRQETFLTPNEQGNIPSTSESARTKPPPPPTIEMLAIDNVMAELTASQVPDTLRATIYKTCFCQGRKHPLAPYAPICYTCGLILCSDVVPSPLSPLSTCPSCAASPLLSGSARADLLSRLSDQRQILAEQQLIQIQMLRDLKHADKQASTLTAQEKQVKLFPKLSDQHPAASSGQSLQQPVHNPVMGKHGALQKARAIAKDAERTAKVLSLDMKTRKVTQARPKAKVVPIKQAAIAEAQVQPEQVNDPFIGLDGSDLVRNSSDDVFARQRRADVSSNHRQKNTSSVGSASIQARAWTLHSNPLLVLMG